MYFLGLSEKTTVVPIHQFCKPDAYKNINTTAISHHTYK